MGAPLDRLGGGVRPTPPNELSAVSGCVLAGARTYPDRTLAAQSVRAYWYRWRLEAIDADSAEAAIKRTIREFGIDDSKAEAAGGVSRDG